MCPHTADDQALMNQLNSIGEAIGPFVFGLLSNTLSVSEQLAFGYRLIAIAGRIRTRVEQQAEEPKDQGGADPEGGEASQSGFGDAL